MPSRTNPGTYIEQCVNEVIRCEGRLRGAVSRRAVTFWKHKAVVANDALDQALDEVKDFYVPYDQQAKVMKAMKAPKAKAMKATKAKAK